MIKDSVRQLCMLSVFCGAALSICPEGNVKKITSVLVTAGLILTILSPFKSIDFDDYALQTAKLSQREAELSADGAQISRRLNRIVIQQEYESYIMDKAAQLDLNILSLKVGVSWSTDGLWVPYSAEIAADTDEMKQRRLSGVITADLGIPAERQHWHNNG